MNPYGRRAARAARFPPGLTRGRARETGMAITHHGEAPKYVGLVLAKYEQNLAHDSYFHAIVWDTETDAPRHVQYAATAYYSSGRAEIDATPEIIARARRWAYGQWLQHCTREVRTTIREGIDVRSLTTRGKAKDLTGTVKRVTDSRYSRGKVALVEGNGRSAWVPVGRLERLEIDAEARMEIRWRAVRRAKDRLDIALRLA